MPWRGKSRGADTACVMIRPPILTAVFGDRVKEILCRRKPVMRRGFLVIQCSDEGVEKTSVKTCCHQSRAVRNDGKTCRCCIF